jgi:hypothetical protein
VRVSLFVTGDMEQAALATSLERLFVGHHFECVPHTRPTRPFASVTSSRLPTGPVSAGVRSHIDELVQRAAAEVLSTRGRHAPDLLLILDDLELANLDQPDVVIECFRTAVSAHLESLGPSLRRRTAEALRTKASLHFAVPMVESWLFADPEGPTRAGVPVGDTPRLACAPNFEAFSTDDTTYLGDDCSWCTKWSAVQRRGRVKKSTRNAHEPLWCRGDATERHRHPKRYLAWLSQRGREEVQHLSRGVSRSRPTHRRHGAARPRLVGGARRAAHALFGLDARRPRYRVGRPRTTRRHPHGPTDAPEGRAGGVAKHLKRPTSDHG